MWSKKSRSSRFGARSPQVLSILGLAVFYLIFQSALGMAGPSNTAARPLAVPLPTPTPTPTPKPTPPLSARTEISTVSPRFLPTPIPTPTPAPVKFFKAIDVDGHNFVLNRKGRVTLVLGTSEDSQEAARAAGEAVYAFQGRHDFQLVVIVDLRGSMANWAPSITNQLTRRNLDDEARNLKPFFLKNGNKENPRKSMHIVTDFKGETCQLLGWVDSSEDLRGILFDEAGVELCHWDPLNDFNKMHEEIQKAIQTYEKHRHGKEIPESNPSTSLD